jgi:penicillin-binding protein 1A
VVAAPLPEEAGEASGPAPGDEAADGSPAFRAEAAGEPDGDGAGSPAPDFALPASGTRPDVAFVLLGMMRQVVEHGTGAAAKDLGRPAAAKTGTAQEHRDAWFVGFTPDLVAGVWIGFDDHAPLGPRETGAGAALPAWLSFMKAAVGARPAADFPPAPDVEFARVDPATGLLASSRDAGAPLVAFLAGTAPTRTADDAGVPSPENFFRDDR